MSITSSTSDISIKEAKYGVKFSEKVTQNVKRSFGVFQKKLEAPIGFYRERDKYYHLKKQYAHEGDKCNKIKEMWHARQMYQLRKRLKWPPKFLCGTLFWTSGYYDDFWIKSHAQKLRGLEGEWGKVAVVDVSDPDSSDDETVVKFDPSPDIDKSNWKAINQRYEIWKSDLRDRLQKDPIALAPVASTADTEQYRDELDSVDSNLSVEAELLRKTQSVGKGPLNPKAAVAGQGNAKTIELKPDNQNINNKRVPKEESPSQNTKSATKKSSKSKKSKKSKRIKNKLSRDNPESTRNNDKIPLPQKYVSPTESEFGSNTSIVSTGRKRDSKTSKRQSNESNENFKMRSTRKDVSPTESQFGSNTSIVSTGQKRDSKNSKRQSNESNENSKMRSTRKDVSPTESEFGSNTSIVSTGQKKDNSKRQSNELNGKYQMRPNRKDISPTESESGSITTIASINKTMERKAKRDKNTNKTLGDNPKLTKIDKIPRTRKGISPTESESGSTISITSIDQRDRKSKGSKRNKGSAEKDKINRTVVDVSPTESESGSITSITSIDSLRDMNSKNKTVSEDNEEMEVFTRSELNRTKVNIPSPTGSESGSIASTDKKAKKSKKSKKQRNRNSSEAIGILLLSNTGTRAFLDAFNPPSAKKKSKKERKRAKKHYEELTLASHMKKK